MNSYVALLRGVTPTNPKMRNENLRKVCADLGFESVATVISSGDIVFDTDIPDAARLETTLESAWPERLGFESTTIIRTRTEIEQLVELAPFGDLEHGRESYLLVTFCKHPLHLPFPVPYQPAGEGFRIVSATNRELFSVTNSTLEGTPGVMTRLQSEIGKEITSRTWLTVGRILEKMG